MRIYLVYMKLKVIIAALLSILLFSAVYLIAFKEEIIDQEHLFTELVVEYGRKGHVYRSTLTKDQEVIKRVINQINTGERIDIDKIALEGFSNKDGRIYFLGSHGRLEFPLYYQTNTVLSESYLISTDIDFWNLK
jgi:hypothetical protein